MDNGFQNADPAHDDFQYLEDLSTAYWYSQVLFAALELEIFKFLDRGISTLPQLAAAMDCRESGLLRLLRAMDRMALVCRDGEYWYNAQVSSLFLVPDREGYMGDFFLYRQYMAPNWATLFDKVSRRERRAAEEPDYKERNRRYVKSMDTLVKQKAPGIADLVAKEAVTGPVLDVGGGAGSLARAILTRCPATEAVLFDLEEVIDAAREIYPDKTAWERITPMSGDFRSHDFDQRFGLIVMSNFLHAYGPDEAKELLQRAVSLLAPDGLLVIHDYFPDRSGRSPQKGALYDITMMLNTFNGACHEAATIGAWLGAMGVAPVETIDLATDTSVMVARGSGTLNSCREDLCDTALTLGFDRAVPLSPDRVVTAPWVRMKCRFGCAGFGNNLQCPPRTVDHEETRAMLDAYTTAILVQGAPPGKEFHQRLLDLEKTAFLAGFHKAFVFGAGPCPVCPACPDTGICRHPDRARPAMEASGIDVYTTARNAGFSLTPVQEKHNYVKYIGLLVLE
ncbi:MAG: methyltransferase domain-containing protein [Desulfobacteraceae bacterium]|nr:methyltransferase domain-containing protein [Desulfobacteraceae bacterium]